MDWKNLDKNAMCYNCFHKKICKTVYQTNDLSIQQREWNCSCYLNNGEVMNNIRLIDANALYRQVKTECNPYGKPTIDFESGNKVLNLIDNAPTIPLPDFKEGYKQAILDGKTNYSKPEGEWIIKEVNGQKYTYFRKKRGN